ncbi:MAG TPA: beta-N-acetylhexosaminidase [Stellaceae bacterium]|nr:beta-N-acetylhexosaminidase [Stellaceae bacterium]
MPAESRPPRALILGCAGERLTEAEARFFAAADPAGFILFRRNCRDRAQVRALVGDLRGAVGRPAAPVLIDQEGGRVARLAPPEWRAYPAPAALARLADPLAEEAVRLGARLIADDLAELGITLDAAPVLDLPQQGADPVIGDRAYGSDPARAAALGRACCDGLLAGGVLPILKHIPGHGRARVDSHHACPRVAAEHALLSRIDFAPFRALAAMPWAMTAHIVYAGIDDSAPATFSGKVIDTIIRKEIGFGGVLISDDIAMGALAGTLAERTRHAIDAGCDLVLHCTGVLAEMVEIVEAAAPLSPAAADRLARGEAMRQRAGRPFDARAGAARFGELLSGCNGARA